MKKAILVIWCLFALTTIVWLAGVFLKEMSISIPDPFTATGLAVAALIAALITWLIARSDYEAWARWLGVAFITSFMGLSLSLLAFLVVIGSVGYDPSYLAGGAAGALAVGLIAGILICRKRVMPGLVAIAVLVALTFALVFFLAERQKSVVREYEQKWSSLQWSMEEKDVFPMAYSRPQCAPWFDSMENAFNKDAEWKKFYEDVIVPLSYQKGVEQLERGESVKAALQGLPTASDSRWQRYLTLDASMRTAMDSCPHVQWFRPADFHDRMLEAPIPNLLGAMKWSRGLLAQSCVAAAQGRPEEAKAALDALHRGSARMCIQGQTLIGVLIGIAMEKMQLVGQAELLAIQGKPADAGTRRQLEATAQQEISWFSGAWKTELFGLLSYLRNPNPDQVTGFAPSLPKRMPFRTTVMRAAFVKETGNYLDNMTRFMQALDNGYRVKEQKFAWGEFRKMEIRQSFLFPNLLNTYGRFLSLITQARLVLLADEVAKYRAEHNNALPADLNSVTAGWRIDPFDEKPLRYRKEADNRFVVYSTGWDGRDDGGQKLYVAGVMDMKNGTKEDIGFRISFD